MTTNEAYNLIYSLHTAIEDAKDDYIDLSKVLKEAHYEYIDSDLTTLLHAGHFGLDCLKRRLEIIACLLKDNDVLISKEYVTEDYYDIKDEELIVERCKEISELCSIILRAEKASNALTAALSSLNPEVFK